MSPHDRTCNSPGGFATSFARTAAPTSIANPGCACGPPRPCSCTRPAGYATCPSPPGKLVPWHLRRHAGHAA
eukprot:2386926-Prorocentrum_lima.AAC.1